MDDAPPGGSNWGGDGMPTKQIWKYRMSDSREQLIQMPEGAEVLCVQLQREHPTLWALVNPLASLEERAILVVGTGWPMPLDSVRYIGTVYQANGLVWHVFEKEI